MQCLTFLDHPLFRITKGVYSLTSETPPPSSTPLSWNLRPLSQLLTVCRQRTETCCQKREFGRTASHALLRDGKALPLIMKSMVLVLNNSLALNNSLCGSWCSRTCMIRRKTIHQRVAYSSECAVKKKDGLLDSSIVTSAEGSVFTFVGWCVCLSGCLQD